MAITYPTTLDTLTSPTSTDYEDTIDHAGQHSNANSAITALETKLGVDSSAVTTTIDYLLKNTASTDPGHKHSTSSVSGQVAVAQGGTGAATLTGLIKGNGTSAFTAVTAPSGAVVGDTDTQTLTNKTLTTPKVGTSINDTGGNEVIRTPATASAVNDVTVTNAATGNAVQISASGDDTNIELKLASKGNKEINISTGYYQGFQTYSPAAAATATLDLSLGNDHRITMPAGNITIAISNAQVGQKFLVSTTQDATGSRTVTWFTTIKWAGGSAPTLTTTASKRDTFGFIVTSSGNYDGFVVGQNI